MGWFSRFWAEALAAQAKKQPFRAMRNGFLVSPDSVSRQIHFFRTINDLMGCGSGENGNLCASWERFLALVICVNCCPAFFTFGFAKLTPVNAMTGFVAAIILQVRPVTCSISALINIHTAITVLIAATLYCFDYTKSLTMKSYSDMRVY